MSEADSKHSGEVYCLSYRSHPHIY